MHKPIHTIHRQPMRSALCLGAVIAPLSALAANGAAGGLNYLCSDRTLAAILLSSILLLIGFLMRLRQIRRVLAKKNATLEKNRNNLQRMGDNLPNIILFQLVRSSDGSFSFDYLSKGCEYVLGIDRSRLAQDAKLAFDHLYEADIPVLQAAARAADGEPAPANLEIRMLDVSGNLKWLRISAVPHRENGALVWDGFMQDISDRKNIETALDEEKHNLQNLFETIDDLLLVCDMNGNLLHANPSVEQRLGYSKDELEEMSLFELYSEHLSNEAYQIVALMQTEQNSSCDLPLQLKDGSTMPVEMNLFQGSWKNRKAIFGVARDTTTRQKTENALRESQQMLQLIIDSIPMSVFWKSKNSVYLGCNKAFIKECNLATLDDVVGKTPDDLFNKETATDMIARDQQVFSTNEPLFNALHSHSRPDGSTGWRETSKILLHDENQCAVGVLGVWHDVTEQNRAEERLKRTLEDMERFNQLMRGRERRTLELKGEINQLLKQLEQPAKYRTTTDGSV